MKYFRERESIGLQEESISNEVANLLSDLRELTQTDSTETAGPEITEVEKSKLAEYIEKSK